MSKNNNASSQIEGGIILIKNLQCFIVSEKVEMSIAKIIRTKFTFKESEKIQLELEINNDNKRTTPSLVTSTSDNTKKKAAWDENIHFVVGTTPPKSSELMITCWNTSIRGFDGRLGAVSEDLANFDKFDGLENKIKLKLRDENPKIEIAFYLYYLSNNPPVPEMQNFEDPSIRNKQIGMMLINNITYKNLIGHCGFLEFTLQQAFHSTAEYWQTTSVVYNPSQQQQQPEWKYPIAMPLIARPDKLIIYFRHGTKGCADARISTGPAGEMEPIWPSLMKGGPVNVGEHNLLEKGCVELKITFDLSCHSIVKSRHIFGKKVRKPPPAPPPRHKHNSIKRQNTDDMISGLSNGGQSAVSSSLSFKNKPLDRDQKYRSQEFFNPGHQRQDSNDNGTYRFDQEINKDIISQMNKRNSEYSISQESNSQSHERRNSSASSKTSKSSRQKTSDKNHSLESYSLQDNIYRSFPKETAISFNGVIYEEPMKLGSITSQTSSSQNFSYLPEIQPLNIIKKKTNSIPKNGEQHVKLGCSPPSFMGLQDHNIYDDYNGYNGNLQKNSHDTLQDNIQAIQPQIPQMPTYIHNKYELISLQKSAHNKVYLGRHIHTADSVIVKLYKSHSRWENEAYFLKVLKSKMIVKLDDISCNPSEEPERFIITRYFGKSLDKVAEAIHDNKVDIKNVLLGICKAVEWCHSKDVVHMDLRPSNIICKDQKFHKIRLCDFEHSKKLGDNIYSDRYSQPLNPLGFTSPELYFFQKPIISSSPTSHSSFSPSSYSSSSSSTYYTSQSSHSESLLVESSIDIFSLGCIIYYLYTKDLLYTSEKELEQLSLTKICEDIEDEQVSILVKWMVAENGSERPNITQVLENSYFE